MKQIPTNIFKEMQAGIYTIQGRPAKTELKQTKLCFRATEVKWQENSGGEEGLCNVNYDIIINRSETGIDSFEFVLSSITGIEIGGERIYQFGEYRIIAPIDFTTNIFPKEVFVDPIDKTIEICLQ